LSLAVISKDDGESNQSISRLASTDFKKKGVDARNKSGHDAAC